MTDDLTNAQAPVTQEPNGALSRLTQMVAIGTRPWVVVVGAGLSSPQISGWTQLYESLVLEMQEKALESQAALEKFALVEQELAKCGSNSWAKFRLLKSAIPVPYRNIIRLELGKSDNLGIPAVYNTLWSLPLRGILSLNLDAFPRRAASRVEDDREIKVFSGKDAGRLQRMLGTPHRFLYELHGKADDEDSWIFTDDELGRLYSNAGYESFLRTVFTQYHVVFIGVGADDIAIGGPLERLAASGISGPEHYWITDRIDEGAASWADAAMVERVLYPKGDHKQVQSILRGLGKAKATEPPAQPVARENAESFATIESPEELAGMGTDDIRLRLNGYARYLLHKGDIHGYNEFLVSYDEVIDRSWYIPQKPQNYSIFEYTITDYAAKGAFGSVYRALDQKGHDVALKLLKREIRGDAGSIHAFRRGVEAMKILESRSVDGMVAYQDASEIPTFVTMDWVEGPNLQAAKEARLVEDWNSILDIFVKATRTISSAHKLPEKVLHRDIRPANIMLRNGWDINEPFDVVVLDFDLATYSGAKTESVLADGSALGYLAPEQFASDAGSRSALVDSFGLGMTLYYLVGRKEPDPYFQRDMRFRDTVRLATQVPDEPHYRATRRRIERLIINATHDSQRDRWSVDIILNEAARILAANGSRLNPLDGDMAAEEIAANCPIMSNRYTWDEGRDMALYNVASGPRISVQGTANSFDVFLDIEWTDDGTHRRSTLAKYLSDRILAATGLLQKAGWQITKTSSSGREAHLDAVMRVEADSNYEKIGTVLSSALENLIFT